MKITQTDKQIIEIIEPYMNKSLSEGVLFEKNVNYKKDGSIGKDIFSVLSIISEENEVAGVYFAVDWYKDEQPEVYYIGVEEFYDNGFKILGHYDITAVLKYLQDKIGIYIPFQNKKDNNYIYLTETFGVEFGEIEITEVGRIPHKPLHLYTEEEKKELLQILEKLNNNV